MKETSRKSTILGFAFILIYKLTSSLNRWIRLFLSDSGPLILLNQHRQSSLYRPQLKMIDRMELFGFDVRRVMDIMELNNYVPTVDKDVDFWVLKYLSCKLMNYTEGTCSVLLHVVK